MTIPYIKGWGDTLKEALPQIGQGIRDIKDPNWRAKEQLEQELLDPNKLQNYANLYHANPQAFGEKEIGKKNVERIRAMTQDPDFIFKRAEATAKQSFMQNPENAKLYAEINLTGSDPVTKQARIADLESKHLRNIQEQMLYDNFISATPEEQQKLLTNQNWRERTGFNEVQFKDLEATAKLSNELRGAIATAREWADKNKQILNSPLALSKAIADGTVDAVTIGALANDPQYQGVVGLANKLLIDDINHRQALERQQIGIAASEASQLRMMGHQDDQLDKRLAESNKVKSRALLNSITSQLFKADKIDEQTLTSSIMPAIQAQLNEWAELNGKAAPILEIAGKTRVFKPNTWGFNGKPRIVYRDAEGNPQPLTAISNFDAVTAGPPRSNVEDVLKDKLPDLNPIEQGLLDNLNKLSDTDVNRYYQGASPETKAKIDEWMTQGRLRDLR